MNPKPISETDALRSDIELTRRRMDDTMNALGERLHGRHLLDEVIGFFRQNSDAAGQAGSRVREKLSQTAGRISDSAGTAAHAVADTVKKNPLPILLIAAGAAWLAYSATRKRQDNSDEEDFDESDLYDSDLHYDRPLEYPSSTRAKAEETEESSAGDEAADTLGGAATSAKERVKQKLSDLGDRTRETYQSARERAADLGSQARERISETVDQHPLEIGLGCLALGALVGLALPTPAPVNRLAGPTVDRLRTRTRDAGRDILQKGRKVVQAATDAARQEAQAQGLTHNRTRSPGGVGSTETPAGGTTEMNPSEQPPITGSTDPSVAKPAM